MPSCVTLSLFWMLYVMHPLWPFFAFISLYCASHLGMLDEPREGWKDMMLESNQKTVLVDKSQRWCLVDGSRRWKDFESICLNRRCSPSKCHLTNTDLVLDPRQAPENSKPPMFLQISLESFMFDALYYRSWLETLDAYTFLVQTYTLNPV